MWLSALFLLLTLTITPVSAQVVQPTNHLAQARAYLESGREDQALAYARRAAEGPSASTEALLFLGTLLQRRGDREGAVGAFSRAVQREPGSDASRARLAGALRDGYPAQVDDSLFIVLPGEAASGELTFRDPRLRPEPSPARRWRTLLVPAEGVRPVFDPKFRHSYTRVCHAYAFQERPARWYRVASVRFRKSWDEGLARRVAALLAQLFWTRREYWSTSPDFPKPPEAEVWLSREGKAGGEEWQGRIYLYEVGRERSPEEWVRQVAHEFGHLALPGEPIYTDPEPCANGYLGERLLIEWLAKSEATVWGGAVNPSRYLARRALPLRARFLREGPRSPLLQRRDRAGMEQYIGMVLAWEAAYGPRLLRSAFDRMLGKNAESFLLGCQEAVADVRPPRLEIPGGALLAQEGDPSLTGSMVWLYLPAGRWTLSVEPVGGAPITARWDGRPLSRLPLATTGWSYSLQLPRDGWHRLSVTASSLQITRIALDRVDGRTAAIGNEFDVLGR
jgi:hypothetical protein